MDQIQIGIDDRIPTYNEVTEKGKKRRARYFGPVTLTYADSKPKVIGEGQYLFIKNEPNTIYTKDIHDGIGKKKEK